MDWIPAFAGMTGVSYGLIFQMTRLAGNQMNQLLEARGARFAAAAASGVLFYFTLGLTPLWLAAWLAPIPLLLAAFHASGREARLLAWLAVAIGLSSNFTYYLKVLGPVATVVVLLLQVLIWGFFVGRTRAAVVASRNWLVVFVYPMLLAAIDTLVSFFSPHGTGGSFAYTQMDALPVIQIASVLGAPAVVFLVGLFASTVAVALYRGLRIERPLLAYGVPLVLIAAGLGYGAVRLRQAKRSPDGESRDSVDRRLHWREHATRARRGRVARV